MNDSFASSSPTRIPLTPSIVVSRVSAKANETSQSSDCLLRNHKPSLLGSSPASYDDSFRLLSQSLEQICRKGSNSSIGGKELSPQQSKETSSRPRSLHVAPVNNSFNISHLKRDQTGSLVLRIRHEETQKKLEQSLSKICFARVANSPNHSTNVKKRISDAQENLKSKFRAKVDVHRQADSLTDLFVTVDPDRTLTVNHHRASQVSNGLRKVTASGNDDNSDDALDFPALTVVHSCKVPEGVAIEKILCSIHEGPSLYMRPSTSSYVEVADVRCRHVPVVHTDEKTMRFFIALKIPREISFENLEIKRVDESLTVSSAAAAHFTEAQRKEPRLRFQIELPEDSDGRSLTAKVTPAQILVVEGKLLPTSRRMTCKF